MTQPDTLPPRFEWIRSHSMTRPGAELEHWTFINGAKRHSMAVRVRTGKTVDIKALKAKSSFECEVLRVSEVRHAFPDRRDFLRHQCCPACSAEISRASKAVSIWETDYFRCADCGHAFADEFPSDQALEQFYANHGSDTGYYIQPEDIELRLREVYRPKLAWAMHAYADTHGRQPRSVLDLGAGAGHFLYACKGQGLAVAGVEYDALYRRWCAEQLGIELAASAELLGTDTFDLVCSFNVIEHTGVPRNFLALHKRFMGPESLCVLETPQFNSLTTAVQKLFPEVVRTHLIPFKHNHLFSDASLSTLLFTSGLRPTDIWRFGQDMTEALFQACHAQGFAPDMDLVSAFMGAPQHALDAAGICDLMLVAATFDNTAGKGNT